MGKNVKKLTRGEWDELMREYGINRIVDPILELKKRRFQFLEKLYEESEADPIRRFSPIEIAAKVSMSLITMGNFRRTQDGKLKTSGELNGILNYLVAEGLIEMDDGKKPLTITHEGIKEVEKSRDSPQVPTERFPSYQTIYNIGRDHHETNRVLGDVFRDIHNATVINRALVENSFNKVKREYDEETSKALVKVAEFIEKSKNPAAGALFDSFNQELSKPQPDKSRLKSFWEGVQNALPSIASISESVARVVSLFA